jgi:glyceraldehyde 3-phosphate dehydrogenase
MIRVAINGYGRIGRGLHRQILDDETMQVVAVNSRAGADSHALLLKRDSIYGTLEHEVSVEGNDLMVDGQLVRVLQEADPAKIPWGELDVDVVIESTGRFTSKEKAQPHLDAGAKKVLITAPCKDDSVETLVMGVNHEDCDARKYDVVSNASCTTNALAPAMKVLQDNFGVESGVISTLHSFTYTQNLLDNSNTQDFRRARATTESIIPTSTGAMAAIDQVIPSLKGKLQGMAFRVPTAAVSVLDMVINLEKETTVDEINEAFLKAESEGLYGILGTSDEPLVSVDYRGDTRSAVVDLLSTKVVNGKMVQLVVWYDNEWGYIARVKDLIAWMMQADTCVKV